MNWSYSENIIRYKNHKFFSNLSCIFHDYLKIKYSWNDENFDKYFFFISTYWCYFLKIFKWKRRKFTNKKSDKRLQCISHFYIQNQIDF